MFFTEFRFISARMVELFDFVMGVGACVVAGSSFLDLWAFGVLILREIGSPVIFLGVIVVAETFLMWI